MLALQRAKGKEAAAFVTTDGRVFVLPMEENLFDKSKTYDRYFDSQGRIVVRVFQAQNSDAPTLVPGRWYLTTAVYDAQGRGHNTTYLLASHTHTHPTNGNENTPSKDDKDFAAKGNYPGLDKYIVNETNMVKYDQTGALSTSPNSCK
jgi:hypothetical protein